MKELQKPPITAIYVYLDDQLVIKQLDIEAIIPIRLLRMSQIMF